VARLSEFLPPPDIKATSNNLNPSWLNPMKLEAARLAVHGPVVFFASDSGGAPLWDPDYSIFILNKTAGTLALRCPGGTGITDCTSNENNPAGGTYWAVIANSNSDVQGILNGQQQLRGGSYRRCVNTLGNTDLPICNNCDALNP
jgi:hypothetical protein